MNNALIVLAMALGYEINTDDKRKAFWFFFNEEKSHYVTMSNDFYVVESWNYGPAKATRKDHRETVMMEEAFTLELQTYAAAHSL